jgi:D-alanyl-lipoteichoic acid acyltransferase DltB (MBOAT superfamily)
MAIGYTIDVYNEEISVEKNIGILALFISFFPLVLSGPIERAKNMLPQFRTEKKFDFSEIVQGLRLMLWGYFMKLVVADRVGIYIDAVYDNIAQHNGTSLLIASLLRPFQIYGDLGGYTLIAIGTARVMGLTVMDNFNRPFLATSMGDFWRRWHMSLITWLTDYIYTPLSFTLRRFRIWGIVIALMLTFLLSGIWHGATVTYVVWGLVQGLLLSIEALLNKRKTAFEKRYSLARRPLYIFLSILFTYILFSASLVFGRAGNMTDAIMVFNKIFTNQGVPYLDLTTLAYSVMGISLIMLKDLQDEYVPGSIRLFSNRRLWIRYTTYMVVVFTIILFGVFGGSHFIYFQF